MASYYFERVEEAYSRNKKAPVEAGPDADDTLVAIPACSGLRVRRL